MSVRVRWTVVIAVAVLLVGALLLAAYAFAGPATGAVRVTIGPGETDSLVDVALVDHTGQEYAGDSRGAGGSETLPLIPAGQVRVHVGTCSTAAVVRPGRTVEVHFDAVDCIRQVDGVAQVASRAPVAEVSPMLGTVEGISRVCPVCSRGVLVRGEERERDPSARIDAG